MQISFVEIVFFKEVWTTMNENDYVWKKFVWRKVFVSKLKQENQKKKNEDLNEVKCRPFHLDLTPHLMLKLTNRKGERIKQSQKRL